MQKLCQFAHAGCFGAGQAQDLRCQAQKIDKGALRAGTNFSNLFLTVLLAVLLAVQLGGWAGGWPVVR